MQRLNAILSCINHRCNYSTQLLPISNYVFATFLYRYITIKWIPITADETLITSECEKFIILFRCRQVFVMATKSICNVIHIFVINDHVNSLFLINNFLVIKLLANIKISFLNYNYILYNYNYILLVRLNVYYFLTFPRNFFNIKMLLYTLS